MSDTTAVPLYLETAAFATVNLGAGFAIRSGLDLTVSATNLFDRNYRVHGSGVDAPGFSFYVGLRASLLGVCAAVP